MQSAESEAEIKIGQSRQDFTILHFVKLNYLQVGPRKTLIYSWVCKEQKTGNH